MENFIKNIQPKFLLCVKTQFSCDYNSKLKRNAYEKKMFYKTKKKNFAQKQEKQNHSKKTWKLCQWDSDWKTEKIELRKV